MRFFSLILLSVVFFTQTLHAEAEYPFRGIVSADSVHIRAGYSNNFDSIAKLNKGDIVIVLGKEYSWLKVQLPETISCYVYSKYISMRSYSKTEVLVDDLNIRLAPEDSGFIVGKLNKGNTINIISKKDNWVEFSPNENCYGWIKADFVDFFDKKIN